MVGNGFQQKFRSAVVAPDVQDEIGFFQFGENGQSQALREPFVHRVAVERTAFDGTAPVAGQYGAARAQRGARLVGQGIQADGIHKVTQLADDDQVEGVIGPVARQLCLHHLHMGESRQTCLRQGHRTRRHVGDQQPVAAQGQLGGQFAVGATRLEAVGVARRGQTRQRERALARLVPACSETPGVVAVAKQGVEGVWSGCL